jgi:hypothetical protein
VLLLFTLSAARAWPHWDAEDPVPLLAVASHRSTPM